MKNPEKPRDLRALSQLYGELLERMSAEPDSEAWMILGDPVSTLYRLREFFELFLSDGLNSEFAYSFGLKDA